MRKNNLITIIFLVIGVVIIINLTGRIWQLWHQDNPLKEAEKRLEKLKEENAELKQKKAYMNSEKFIEEQARDKLNLAKENEAIVILPEEILKLKTEENQEKEEKELANWQKWLEVFR